MKKITYLFIAILFFASGCSEDYLQRDSLSAIGSTSFWSNEADAELALMGAYSGLQSMWIFNSNPWSGGLMRMEYISDNGHGNWAWMPLCNIPRNQHSPGAWGIPETWSDLYRVIARANLVIEQVPLIEDIEASASAQIVAEAKMIRATTYLVLAMTFQDVPLVTEPLTADDYQHEKVPQEEIFGFIIPDLEAAVDDLADNPGTGRASKGAGYALLGRLNLYAGNYAAAASAAKQVIDMGRYTLFPDYKTLFSPDNETSSEIIWGISFDRILDNGAAFAGYWGQGAVDYQRVLPNLVDEYYKLDGTPAEPYTNFIPGDYDPASGLYPAFADRDPRLDATIVLPGFTWRGSTFTYNTPVQRKYTEEGNDEDHFDSPQDFYFIRYAHVLLCRAEALVRAGGYNETEVIGLINQVRNRVGMPTVESVEGTGLSPDKLLDVILHERRVETAFEGLRLFDLVRLNKVPEAYDTFNNYDRPYMLSIGWPGTGKIREIRIVKWPIPQSELDANKAISQHSDW